MALFDKRTLATAGWKALIFSVTGEAPYENKGPRKTVITWKPGQAAKMEQFLKETLFKPAFGKGTYNPKGFNTEVDLSSVLMPLFLKQYWPYIAGLLLIGGVIGWGITR